MDTLLDENGHPLPQSSLHLFVPPLRLVSAALWRLVESRTVMDYGLVEEFVVTVLETVPHLLSFREKVQLIMGLRAQLILELCRCDHLASPEIIQPHLARISSCISRLSEEVSDPKVEATVTNFCKMVETLLVNSKEREVFFQDVFPKDFGPQYDLALQALLWRFLARLEKLIPVPDLREVVLWLTPGPVVLEECVKSVAHPEPLKKLLEYHKKGQSRFHNKVQASSSDKDIFSALSPVMWMKKSVAPEGCPLSSDDEDSEPGTGAMYIESQPGRWVLVPDWEVPPKRPIVSSVEVEVEQPDEEEDVTVSRKPAVKRPDKKDKKDAAFFFPKTRGGLKPDRIAAMCKRRQLRVLLSRQDITGLLLPATRTLSLRKGDVLAGDASFSRKHKRSEKDITCLPLPVGTEAGNVPFSEPVKRKRGRPRKTEKMGETAPDCPETKPDGSDRPSALLCRTLRSGGPLTEEESGSVQVRKRRRVERSGTEKSATEKNETKTEILPKHDPNRSGEDDVYIIPEESRGKGDETVTAMEDPSYIEKPSRKKSLAGLPKARKSAPSSNPFQIKKCLHCAYFHQDEEKVQQHMQLWHPEERRRKRRRRHPDLASKKEETIVSKQDPSEDRSGEEDVYIIPEESSGKDDIIKMEDSICTEKPSHKKPLAGHPKARKSAPSSKPHQIKKCRHCPYFYREEEKLQRHMELWHPACPRCGKTFIDKLDLEKHLQTHAGEQSRPRCTCCNREFESSVELEEHVQTGCDGTNNSDNNRDKNGECCFTESDHSYHLQYNSDNSDEDSRDRDGERCLPESDHNYHSQTPEHVQQKCRMCYAELSGGIALISHLKIFHLESPYKCFSCGHTFETHQDLKCHQTANKNCFSNMRRCPICGYVLQQTLDIQRHIVWHLNNGELKCKACPMTFLDLSDVRDHLHWSRRCRDKCYGEGQSPAKGHSASAAEGHSDKKETKADQGHSLTGNLGGVNVVEKVHNTRHRGNKRPSLIPKKVDETRDKKRSKRRSLVPKKEDEIRDKKRRKRPSLVPKKVDEIRDKRRGKRPSLVPKKENEIGGEKRKRPSLVPKKVDEIRDKRRRKRPSLVPKKEDETRDKKRRKRPSLLPKKENEIRGGKRKRPSLVPKKEDETRDKKRRKRHSLMPKKVDETRDKKKRKRLSLMPKKVDETRDKKVDDTRDKQKRKRLSLMPKKVDETRDKKEDETSDKNMDDTRDKKRRKRLSLMPKKVDETRDKKRRKRPSLVPKKLQETRPEKVDETMHKQSMKRPPSPKTLQEMSHKRRRKRPSLKLQEMRTEKVDETSHKRSMERPSLLPKNRTVSKMQQCSECGIVKDRKFDMERHLRRHYSNGHNELYDPACLNSSRDSRNRRKKPRQRRSMSTGEGSTFKGNTVHTTVEQRPSSDQHILHNEVERESSAERPNLNGCFKVKDDHSQRGEKMGLYFIRRVDFLTSQPDKLHLLMPTMYNVPEPYGTTSHQVDTSTDESVGYDTTLQQVDTSTDESVGYDTTLQQVDTSTDESVMEEEDSVVILPLEERYGTALQKVHTFADWSVEEEDCFVLVPVEERYGTTLQRVDTSTDQSAMQEEESLVLVPEELD